MSDIQVFGADGCEDTARTREHLETLGLHYDYLNVDQSPEAKQWVMAQNDGKQKTPTVRIANKVVLSEPSDAELDIALRKNGLIK